jgi:glyoxylase-like metal-dependent hydrolase (beta-lactamase superfamily II)
MSPREADGLEEDPPLQEARHIVENARSGETPRPVVTSFFDEATFTASHVVHDPETRAAAIVDSVMDFDQASGRISFGSADRIIDHVRAAGLGVQWILETHAHADHMSAAPYLQQKLGGRLAIGKEIVAIQEAFGKLFNEGPDFVPDGSQFDQLLADGDRFSVGNINAIALQVPGHTPVDMAFVIGDVALVGDTMFMPDYGSARADFPGGDARQLYRSVRRLLSLPDNTRIMLCHDYKAPNRDEFVWETTVLAERAGNVHLHDGVSEDEFVAMRKQRDATLAMPKLILPSLQVNMRGGHLPPSDERGRSYLKIPLNLL